MRNPTSSSWRCKGRWRTRALLALAIAMPIVGVPTPIAVDAAPGESVVVYDAIGSAIPGNVISQAFQATQAAEFGDMVALATGPRALAEVTVLMSSWGCQSGAWFSSDCVTTPGTTFNHPLTLNVYSVTGTDAAPVLGTLLATTTQSFAIPFRPSTDSVNCTGGRWFNGTTCFNGFATPVTFTFPGTTVLPTRIVWSIAFNTSSYGAAPMGTGTACFSTPQGCGYDSLNVGAESLPGAPIAGTDVTENDAFFSSQTAGQYCAGASQSGSVGSLRNDPGCWTGYRPLAKITTRYASVNSVVVKASALQNWVVDTTVLGNPAVPFGFTGPGDNGSGNGSFRFGPIAAPNGSKLEMQPPVVSQLVSAFGGMQYDFRVITPVAGTSANHFYTNVYVDSAANGIGFFGPNATTSGFYDCRYSFVPSASAAGWNTFSFSSSTVAVNPTNRIPLLSGGCGATTIGGATAGSQIQFFRLNGGDTSANDNGLEGAYDLVSLTFAGETTTFDFETESATVVVKASALQNWVVDTTVLGNPAVPFAFSGPPDSGSGNGSFRFGPIAAPNGSKQEMQPPIVNTLVSTFGGMQYEYQVVTPVAGNSANQFYTNVYVDSAANGIGFFGPNATTSGFYDCRYSFVPSSNVAGWNTFSFDSSTVAVNPTNRIPLLSGGCGATTIGGAAAGSQIQFFRINGGDTSASDNGLVGAYDLVRITAAGLTTTFDFETETATVVVQASALQNWIVDTTVLGNSAVPFAFSGPPDSGSGNGSFRFGPIAAPNGSKQEMQPPIISTLVSEFGGVQYEYQVITPVAGNSANQFYTNVYVDSAANGIGFFGPNATTSGFYDCRYSFVPSSNVAGWNTFSFDSSTVAVNPTNRIPLLSGGCGATTIGGAAAGSQIQFFRLNGGDTSASDNGLVGAYDLVRITTAGLTTTFDFETEPVIPLVPPINSARILDTRNPGGTTVDGLHQAVGKLAADQTYELLVAGRAGLPPTPETVVFNVTAVQPSGPGFITVYACGQPRPNASNINFLEGEVIANSVSAQIGVDGKICIFTSTQTDVLVDVTGVLRALEPLPAPARVLDTRTPFGETADGAHQEVGRLAAGATYELPVAGRVGVAPGAATVVLNVASILPSSRGFVTVFPCGQTRPNASNLNYVVGDQIANSLLARVGADGKVCVYSSAETDIIVDVSGYFTDFVSLVQLAAPSRMLDTRSPGGQTVDDLHEAVGKVAAGSTYELPITGRIGIPSNAESVVLNVTAVQPSAGGFITVFACGQPVPNASNLNFFAGDVIPNLVLVTVGAGGSICLYSSAQTDILVDISGYFAP